MNVLVGAIYIDWFLSNSLIIKATQISHWYFFPLIFILNYIYGSRAVIAL